MKKARGLNPAKEIEMFSLHPFPDELSFYLSYIDTYLR